MGGASQSYDQLLAPIGGGKAIDLRFKVTHIHGQAPFAFLIGFLNNG
jgi:hypothetical protein